MKALSLLLLLAAAPAAAQWIATGTCCVDCGGGTACGSGSEEYGSQAECNARLSQGSSVCADYTGCTIVSFSPGSCTCSGSNCGGFGGGFGSGSSAEEFFSEPEIAEAFGDFTGHTPTSGQGSLSQGVGTTNRVAQEQGQASFYSHANNANQAWLREAAARLGNNNMRSGWGSPRSDDGWNRGMNRAAHFFTAWIPRGPRYEAAPVFDSLTFGQPASPQTANYQANFVNLIQPGGQPITGAGASVGPADPKGTPSPEVPQTGQVENKVQSGSTACRDKTWFFNNQTQMCYPTQKNCEASCTKANVQCVCRN